MTNHQIKWNALILLAEDLDAQTQIQDLQIKDLIPYLETLEIEFQGEADPLLDFEAYCLYRFTQKLRHALEKISLSKR